ncbi:uncharacterized protein CDV56_104917 [Aspergillus thermomutatus]|uniref:Cytochrome c oxidase subunit 4, mitochondrial n=1 Tax=Aspergillus thermomutatus TaxID=41047 RepID=A0A397HYM5_ASPTH|nr:uncharacterized protein CDV56_104917 [Aspergillus thermomutatus]RHZ68112.1 hypothetical protein CDV56_104917 [Aspergillus thermomutatus]
MSVTLADPYRDYALDYAQHAKQEGHENALAYQTQQSHIQRHKEPNPPFPQGSSHNTAYEQHHASTTVLPAANPDISQSVVLTPAHMLPRQLPMQYTPATFEIPTVQRGKKRPHSETEGEGDHGDHGVRPRFHGFGPPESMALPQQHHHHRLPPQASLHSAERHGMNVETSPIPSGPPSVVGQPGMPDPAPRPRGPKLKFTQEEDALLVELKENKNLTWKQIADFFPGRTSGTLQVRYCTKLKAKDVTWTDEMRTTRVVWAALSQVVQSTAGRNGFKLTSNLQTPSPPNLLPPLVQPSIPSIVQDNVPPTHSFRPRQARPGQSHRCSSFFLLRRPLYVNPKMASTTSVYDNIVSCAAQLSLHKAIRITLSIILHGTLANSGFSRVLGNNKKYVVKQEGKILPFEEIKTEEDLLPPGAKPGTVPTDVDQSTGLERLELIGKMQGIDIFDMRPLDASRKGTLDNPIIVKSAGDEQYAGCTGYPADSHHVVWLTVSRDRPIERCGECGNVVKLEYVGPEEDLHAHDHGHGHHPPQEEVKTFADYVKPEYWYR